MTLAPSTFIKLGAAAEKPVGWPLICCYATIEKADWSPLSRVEVEKASWTPLFTAGLLGELSYLFFNDGDSWLGSALISEVWHSCETRNFIFSFIGEDGPFFMT